MRHITTLLIRLFIICLCGWSFSAPSAFADVRMVVEHWPPWEIANDPERQQVDEGIAVELTQEIIRRYGDTLVLETVPWKRALSQMKLGSADLIPMITRTTERQEYMVFTQPIYTDPIVFAYMPNRFKGPQWETHGDLKQYVIGVVHDYVYGSDWKEAVEKYELQVEGSNKDIYNVNKLRAGRYDLVLLYRSVAFDIFKDLPADHGVALADKPFDKTHFRFGISKKSPLVKDVHKINAIIDDMRADGSFKKIMREYAD